MAYMVNSATRTGCIVCHYRDTSKLPTPKVSPSVAKVEVKALSKEQNTIFLSRGVTAYMIVTVQCSIWVLKK